MNIIDPAGAPLPGPEETVATSVTVWSAVGASGSAIRATVLVATTTAVWADAAAALVPPALVAVPRTASACPTSPAPAVYVCPVAPAIAEQAVPRQRSH